MRIAIPSYRRPDTLAAKTLPLLLDRGVDPKHIDVFVSDPDSMGEYGAVVPAGVHLIPGQVGMRANRSVMKRHYPRGAHIVAIDDDITDIIELDATGTGSQPLEALPSFFEHAFQTARDNRLNLWGVYPVANHYFMKPKLSFGLTYIVGCLYGWVADPEADWHHTVLDDKEDFERSIRFYEHDGGVLRINWVAPVTNYYREPGGMQVERTEERINESVQYLLDTYPQYAQLNTRRKEHAEVKLSDRRARG